ncbi:MAG: ATP-dependent DNA ligase [Candidatus Diapherotrites archaeon]
MKFSSLAGHFSRIEKASSRLEMAGILAEMLAEASADEIASLVYLCQGKVAPSYAGIETGMGEKFIEEAIAQSSGHEKTEVVKLYKKLGDLGLVAEELASSKKQRALFSSELTLEKVFANFLKISKTAGKGTQDLKIKLLAELLNSAGAAEARYIIRIPLGNLRLGIGDPTIMDAFALNYAGEFVKKEKRQVAEIEKNLKEKKQEKRDAELALRVKQKLRGHIEEKYNIHSDLGHIGELLKKGGIAGLERVEITPGVPIRPTLAERLPSAEEIVKKLGKCAVEAKYDGFRLQCHKQGNEIAIFSRNSENMTHMFPEIVKAIRAQIKPKDAIFEGEALAYSEETNEYLPFQATMRRKRKYDIGAKSKEFPLRLFVFDVMYAGGEDMMPKPFIERRKKLAEILGKGDVIALTDSIMTDDAKKINEFFERNVGSGLEGIIAKDLNAKYIAGARKFAWIKLKRSYRGELNDSVDVVIIGYFKGRGQRTKFGLGALLTAVYDSASSGYKSVAKIGTGLSEEQLGSMEKMLGKIKTKTKPPAVDSELVPDAWVEPRYVIEVVADEITRSPIHAAGKEKGESGYALRFPRMVSVRSDKSPEDATTVKEIIKMHNNQKRVSLAEK